MEEIKFRKTGIEGDTIRLDQFLKWVGVAVTGGQAKTLIQDSCILVNGNVETRRGRKLKSGDRVSIRSNERLVYEIMGDTDDAP